MSTTSSNTNLKQRSKSSKKNSSNNNISNSSIDLNSSRTSLNSTSDSLKSSPKNKKQQNGNSNHKINHTNKKNNSKASMFDKDEMAKYVIWRRPIFTLYYFTLELAHLIIHYFLKIINYRKLVFLLVLMCALITFGFYTDGSHLPILLFLRKKVFWCAYWMGLGIASSIGLGTGLHTFLLYLGPFIASVTLAAYECDSLNFPEPPYPDEILCPSSSRKDGLTTSTISILAIMSKVRLESFMWGAGTAIGELPPYFMARASALSNNHSEEQDEEFEELLRLEQNDKSKLSILDKMRLYVFKIIKKVGFLGILLCASIPNPLFDLAGITCGHFLVKFWTFFGATLIGKAVIKMHIQKMFVIFLFSEHHLASLFDLIATLPYIGDKIQPLFIEWLSKEKSKLHQSNAANHVEPSESILSWALNKIVLLMVLFFVVSIINSLAQRRYKRLNSHLPHGTTTNKVAND